MEVCSPKLQSEMMKAVMNVRFESIGRIVHIFEARIILRWNGKTQFKRVNFVTLARFLFLFDKKKPSVYTFFFQQKSIYYGYSYIFV